MKALKLKILAVAGCLFLTACAGTPQNDNAIKVSERFKGMLPCDNCRAINTDLILKRNAVTGDPDGFYLHEVKIDGAGGNRVSTSWGKWFQTDSVNNDQRKIYILWPEVGPQRSYQLTAEGDALQPLDNQGKPLNTANGTPVALKEIAFKLSHPETDTAEEEDE